MMPSLFAGSDAEDEYSRCEHLGPKAAEVMTRHRETHITEADIAWLADRGVNALGERLKDFNHDGDMCVGEGSLAMAPAPQSPLNPDPTQMALFIRAFAGTQLFTYEQTRGWFLGSYNAENAADCSFRENVQRGNLPPKMPTAAKED